MPLSNPIIAVTQNIYEAGIIQPWQQKTANYTADPGNRIIADTTAGTWTLNLSVAPNYGDELSLLTFGAATNPLTISSAAQINGSDDDLVLTGDRLELRFIYLGATGWIYTSGAATSGETGGGGTSDPDVDAVINTIQATGVTLTDTQKAACRDRIAAMKSNGSWVTYVGYYGLLGGTAAAHAINWKSPGSYNMLWSGGVTHSVNGVQRSDATGHGRTGYIPNNGVLTTSMRLAFYSRTESGEEAIDAGVITPGNVLGAMFGMYLRYASGSWCFWDTPPVIEQFYFPIAGSAGYICGNKDGAAAFVSRNGATVQAKSITAASLKNQPFSGNQIFFLAGNDNNTPFRPSSRQFASFGFGYALTQAQEVDEYAAEQSYQQALGRAV